MITTTVARMSGKLIKHMGWWQFLLLGGLCAWVSTPLEAQQGGLPGYSNGPGSRGFMQDDDGDDIPQPRNYGPAVPRSNSWDDFSGQSAPHYSPAIPQPGSNSMDYPGLQPGQDDWAPSRRMSTPGNAPAFRGQRRHRSNFRGSDPQSPDFLNPAFQSPGYQPQNQNQQLFPAYPDQSNPGSGMQGQGWQGQGFQGQNSQGPGLQGPSFLSPSLQGPSFQGPAMQGPSLPGSNFQNPSFQTPNFQNPNSQSPNFQSPGYQNQGLPGLGAPNQGLQGPVPNLPGQGMPSGNFGLPGYPAPGMNPNGNVPGLQNSLPQMPQQNAPVNPAQDTHNRISRRYQNRSFVGLLNLSPQDSMALYGEVMQMIDTRHLEPSPLQTRVQKGMTNLMYALDNPAFVQVNQLQLQPANVQAYRQALQQAMQSPVQSEQDAMKMLNWTMQMSQQQIGLRPAAAAMEFVYGAVESLDKYSAFVPPENVPGASLQLESSLVGIGVQIEMRDQGAEVMKVITGSPAQTAGLKQGDMLLAVSGQQLEGKDVDHTVSLISGPEGSQVVLGVQRQGQGVFTVTATRQSIQLHSVNDVQMLAGTRVGYFKLDKFTSTSADEVENALQQLYRQGMQGLVMDLRGNPGGLLTSAIQISDEFLPQGTIVATRGRNSSDNTEEHAKKEHTWKIPLVVIVDHDSASASEIFAAAIQENQRGLVVGRTSYGKGTVQTQFPLQSSGCSLRITTAKFYSPNGREMAGSGVTPDVPVTSGGNSVNAGYGAMDQDIVAAVNVFQQGNSLPNRNQNLSGLPGMPSQRVPQPFVQPQLVPMGR